MREEELVKSICDIFIEENEGKDNNTEIERKWLIPKFPDLEDKEESIVQQYYLISKDDIEYRCRREETKRIHKVRCYETVKIGNGLTRTEYQEKISLGRYYILKNLTIGEPIIKIFKKYESNGIEFVVALVDDLFYCAEIEFDTEEEANNFNVESLGDFTKDWVEVTGNKDYYLKNVWKNKNNL